MSTYFDAIPLDLRRLILPHLPFEKAQVYCNFPAFRMLCNDRFWTEYNQIHYDVTPEIYPDDYDALQMAIWIQQFLEANYKNKKIPTVSSLRIVLNNLDELRRSKTSYWVPNSEQSKPLAEKMLYIAGLAGKGSHLIAYERLHNTPIETPINKDTAVMLRNAIQKSDSDPIDTILRYPGGRQLYSFVTDLYTRPTRYFTPKGIVTLPYDDEVFHKQLFTNDGKNLEYVVYQHKGKYSNLDNLLRDPFANYEMELYDKNAPLLFD